MSEQKIADFEFWEEAGTFWCDIAVNERPVARMGPFDTAEERRRAYEMIRPTDGADVPS